MARHFRWMQQYGLDGVLLQRFVTDIPGNRAAGDVVLKNVMAAARSYGRVFAIEYDISGANAATVAADLQSDWKYLVETLGVTAHPGLPAPQRQAGGGVWGIGLSDDRTRPTDPAAALQLIDWFRLRRKSFTSAALQRTGRHSPTMRRPTGAGPMRIARWTASSLGQWAVIPTSPARIVGASTRFSQTWPPRASRGQLYMPVIFPGFSWHNLNRTSPENQIPRNRGEFLWRQAYNARAAGAQTLKIAMFDEVNEATAMFKLAARRQDAPDQGYWLTLDADGFTLPSDWYLRLAGEISRAFHGMTPCRPCCQTSPHRGPIRPSR